MANPLLRRPPREKPGTGIHRCAVSQDKAKINNIFRLLEEFGTNLGLPHARRIEGRLWELRPDDNRLFYFLYMEHKFVILHGFRKQSTKTPEKEIATALRRIKEISEE